MPERGISRQRLWDHFRRLWSAYLAGIVLLCFLNNLAYTVTRPRISDDALLKVMLLNAEGELSPDAQAELLQRIQTVAPDLEALEFEPLAAAGGDPNSEMLLAVQLTGGFGDVYITDAAGLESLVGRNACLPIGRAAGFETALRNDPETGAEYAAAIRLPDSVFTAGEAFLVAAKNGTNIESTLAALPILAAAVME